MWHAIFSVGFHIKRILKKFDSVLEILEIFVGFEINSNYKKNHLKLQMFWLFVKLGLAFSEQDNE